MTAASRPHQFTLWHACGWGTLPVSVAIAFLLLGIEEIGVQVEEPFAILPLGAPCLPRPCRLQTLNPKMAFAARPASHSACEGIPEHRGTGRVHKSLGA